MKSYERLLSQNKGWAKEQLARDPEYFQRLARVQRPEFLWIGCSDSRMPADRITGTVPGEMFVHRNIAALVVSADVNLLSVLEFAVRYLKVRHVIVCGHYGCGGVEAALSGKSYGVIDTWLEPIKDLYARNAAALSALKAGKERSDRVVELLVAEQVRNLARTTAVQRTWREEGRPHLHGWVYRLDNGVLNPVFDLPPKSELEPIFRFGEL